MNILTHCNVVYYSSCFECIYNYQPYEFFPPEEVWKVARYTCAAPTIFKEMDDFVDGGLLAQNPSTLGIARIQEYYQAKGQTLPVSLVVSIGSGIPPDRELGSLDAQDFLSFGLYWFDKEHSKKFSTLMTVLTNAVSVHVSTTEYIAFCLSNMPWQVLEEEKA